MHALTQAVKAEACRLGFLLAGVTTPNPPPHLAQFRAWLEAGCHGEMDYLASERSLARRADPQQVLLGCQSILVLAAPYCMPGKDMALRGTQRQSKRLANDEIASLEDSLTMIYGEERSDEAIASLTIRLLRFARNDSITPAPYRGQVAAYAWGEDYHDVLQGRLAALAHSVEMQSDRPVAYRAYTDSGPLLERDLAQRAGLGWIGKNTCLIHPKMGSYFFLAEILLDIALEPDEPFQADRCGACTRCLDACPTQCIRPDRTLDARRCIAYLTIEQKGAIPDALRAGVGDWLFGCDICQQVCPWNRRFAQAAPTPAFAPRQGLPSPAAPDLLELLALDETALARWMHGSALKRSKRRGLLRNAAVALGNLAAASQDPQATMLLAKTLEKENEPLVRQHLAWALGQVGGAAARQALEKALQNEQDNAVRAEIQHALGRME